MRTRLSSVWIGITVLLRLYDRDFFPYKEILKDRSSFMGLFWNGKKNSLIAELPKTGPEVIKHFYAQLS